MCLGNDVQQLEDVFAHPQLLAKGIQLFDLVSTLVCMQSAAPRAFG
jgi:hypothetical protein